MPERRPPSAEQEPPVEAAASPAKKAAPRKAAVPKAAVPKDVPTRDAAKQATPVRAAPSEVGPTAPAVATATAPATQPPAAFPVRAGEEPWTPAELAALRDELSGELERLARDIATLETSIADVLRDSGDGAGDDTADTGSKAFEREQEMTLLANARETRFQTQRAVQAIEDRTYGRCESCSEAIGKARVQAFPRATLCVSCKQRQERR